MITPDRTNVQDAIDGEDEVIKTIRLYGFDDAEVTNLIILAIGLRDGQYEAIGEINGGQCFINNKLEILGGANYSPRHKKFSQALITYARVNLGI